MVKITEEMIHNNNWICTKFILVRTNRYNVYDTHRESEPKIKIYIKKEKRRKNQCPKNSCVQSALSCSSFSPALSLLWSITPFLLPWCLRLLPPSLSDLIWGGDRPEKLHRVWLRNQPESVIYFSLLLQFSFHSMLCYFMSLFSLIFTFCRYYPFVGNRFSSIFVELYIYGASSSVCLIPFWMLWMWINIVQCRAKFFVLNFFLGCNG